MAGSQRSHRIADQLQRELAEIIAGEIKDPRIGMVTITGTRVSPDLQHAKVFVTSLADAKHRDDMLRGLQSAAGFMRSLLVRRMKLHATPELHFEYDASIERGIALSKLIDEAVGAPRTDQDQG
jgi:ribosome-binding factor A